MVLLCLSFVQKKVTMLYSSPKDMLMVKFDFRNFSVPVTRSSICSSFEEDFYRVPPHPDFSRVPPRPDFSRVLSTLEKSGCRLNGQISELVSGLTI